MSKQCKCSESTLVNVVFKNNTVTGYCYDCNAKFKAKVIKNLKKLKINKKLSKADLNNAFNALLNNVDVELDKLYTVIK